jgi:hypothetical protein
VPVVADLLDVLDAQAGLAVDEPATARVLGPEEEGQQRLHAAAGEERRRVVLGDERSPRDDDVAPLGHVVEEGAPDRIRIHAPSRHHRCGAVQPCSGRGRCRIAVQPFVESVAAGHRLAAHEGRAPVRGRRGEIIMNDLTSVAATQGVEPPEER